MKSDPNKMRLEIVIPQGARRIAIYGKMDEAKIETLRIPSSVEYINNEGEIHYRSTLPYEFEVDSDNPNLSLIDGVLYSKDGQQIILHPLKDDDYTYSIRDGVLSINDECFCCQDHLTDIDMPNTVEKIGFNAFLGCSSLKSIQLPASLREFSSTSFKGCSLLESISLNESNSYFRVVDNVIYTKDMKELCFYPKEKKDESFIVPDGVVTIWWRAFEENKYLKNVTLPKTIRSIGAFAFSSCEKLQIVELPNVSVSIEDCAFNCCKALNSISLGSRIKDIGLGAFFGCRALTNCKLGKKIEMRLLSTKKECKENNLGKKIKPSVFSDTPIMKVLYSKRRK